MVVSMIQILIELPEAGTIKDKRRVVRSIRDKLRVKFRMSVAEVDLQDSLAFAQIGGALVSNSKEFGEKVMQKALMLVEDQEPVRIHDVQIYSEVY
jgi:uncharacterized protein YlxP (DUF503 family)